MPITAASLGIHLSEEQGLGIYKWLVASFLIGKRIRSTVAVEAYQNLVVRNGLDTPNKLANCPRLQLVKLLGQAGYARYDESTARRLHSMGTRLVSELEPQLQGDFDLSSFQQWLLSFDGIGPKTIEIFMREFGSPESRD